MNLVERAIGPQNFAMQQSNTNKESHLIKIRNDEKKGDKGFISVPYNNNK